MFPDQLHFISQWFHWQMRWRVVSHCGLQNLVWEAEKYRSNYQLLNGRTVFSVTSAHFTQTLFLFTRDSCIYSSLQTSRNVREREKARERERTIHVLKHLNTFHLLQLQRRGYVSQLSYSHMPEQRTSLRKRRRVKGGYEEDRGRKRQEERCPWLRMILQQNTQHVASQDFSF